MLLSVDCVTPLRMLKRLIVILRSSHSAKMRRRTAPLENRIKRVAARNGISENEAKDRIKKTDKSRASYYNYYSAKDWGDAKSYDLCIDSSLLGIDGTVELLKDLIRIKDIK